jgi:hypothetical protein
VLFGGTVFLRPPERPGEHGTGGELVHDPVGDPRAAHVSDVLGDLSASS